MSKIILLLMTLLISIQTLAEEKKCYSGYRLKGQENLPPCDESIKASTTEELIQKHIEKEVGEQVKYKGQHKRVIGVNLIDQVAGKHQGKQLADIEFLVDPDMMKTVSKNGAIIDVQRVLQSLSNDAQFKSSNVALILMRPYVIDPNGKQQQILKVEFNTQDLLKIDWSKVGAPALEKLIAEKGKVKSSPYLLQNGGQHLVLKKEHLGL